MSDIHDSQHGIPHRVIYHPANEAMLVKCIFLMTIWCIGAPTFGGAADQFPADTDFVRRAEQSGNQEIANARDAIASSKDPAIHALAKRSEKDGSEVTRRLATLSIEKGWPTPALDPPDTMSSYSDHRYVVRQLQAQQRALVFYSEEAANVADTELRDFARDRVAILRQSLASLRLLRIG